MKKNRNIRSFSEMKRKFSEQEDLEEKVDDVIEDVEQKEGEGIETAEDIAILVMAMDAEKVAESPEAQELLGEITGLPEEGVDMIMEIKTSLEGKEGDEDSEEEEAKETFSAILTGVRKACKRFSRKRKFSSRRKFNEEDVQVVADMVDDDVLDIIPEDAVAGSVANLMEDEEGEMGKAEVIEAFSKRRALCSVRKKLNRKISNKKFSGMRGVINRLQGSAVSARRRMSGRVRSRMPARRFSSRPELGSLRPARTETTGFRKINNDRNRYQTVRPRDPQDLNAGYKGERFSSRTPQVSGLDFLSKLAGK